MGKPPAGREDAVRALDVGRALSRDEEIRLLAACKASRSRSLFPAVLLSIHSGLRNQELRLLRWRQIDLLERSITVGKSKTTGGEGRCVPLIGYSMALCARVAEPMAGSQAGALCLPV